MYFYKVNNIMNNGTADYKGLNLTEIISGTQVYPHDFKQNNICLLASGEEIESREDLERITEDIYEQLKGEIISAYPIPDPSPEEKIKQLEQQIIAQQYAINMILGV